MLAKWRKWKSSISAIRQKDQKEIAKEVSRRNLEFILDESLDGATFQSFSLLYDFSGHKFDPNRIHDLTSNIRTLIAKFITKYGYRDESVLRDLKAEVAINILCLLEANAFTARYRGIPLLYWLMRFNPSIPKVPLFRTLAKTFLSESTVKAGRGFLDRTRLSSN